MNLPNLNISNSWKVTLAAIIIAIVTQIFVGPLGEIGIVIEESQLNNLVYLALGIGATGGAVSTLKKREERKKVESLVEQEKESFGPPELVPVGATYQTNFRQDPKIGNVIDYGQAYLWVRIQGVASYVTATLKAQNGNVIQIDQSSEDDEDKDITTTRLELFDSTGAPLSRGIYTVIVKGDSGTSDSIGFKNKFEIV